MDSILSRVLDILITLPVILVALSVHEMMHGYASYRLGDPTAKIQGRLSMNPLRHIDPIGFLCLVFLRFGWAKPVSVDARYFKKPKRDMALVALAGLIIVLTMVIHMISDLFETIKTIFYLE